MKHKHGEELPKHQSSGKCVIVDDALDCCLNCIRRRRRGKKPDKHKNKRRI